MRVVQHPQVLRMATALFMAAAFFAFPSLSIAAAETPAAATLVRGLEFTGLKRTRSIVLERILGKYVGKAADDIDFDEIRSKLLETGLFENIEISVRDDSERGAILVVSLDEKWSIIPAPIFGATSEGWFGGLGIIDANAFGLAHQAIAVGMLQSTGWAGFLRYASEPLEDQSFGWAASAAIVKGSMKIVDDEDAELIKYDAFLFDSNFELKRAFGPTLSAFSGIGFRECAVDEDVPEPGRVVPLSIGLIARRSSWDGIFLSQRSMEMKASYSFALVGDGFASLEGRATLEQPLFPGLRAIFNAGGIYAPETPIVFEEGPHAAGVAILPSDFRSPSIFGSSIGLEARIFGSKMGTVTALAAYQIAIAQGEDTDAFAQGPSFGLRLYLAKIAVPAVDVGAAYNAETGIWRAAFGIGMRM